MKKDERLSPLGAEMLAGLTAFRDALDSGEPLEKRFTVRTVHLDLQLKTYGPDDVKAFRGSLRASQPLLAKFLGVSVKTIRSWEQGLRPVPPMACRFLDEIAANPKLWMDRIRVETGRRETSKG